MREGPLAALFRKTTEDTGDGGPSHAGDGSELEAGGEPESGAQRPDEHRALPAVEDDRPQAPVRAPAAVSVARAGEPEREPAGESESEPRWSEVPSPQERLRQAFSADIPANMLERPAE
ncbi:MAG: hypothetical protein M3Y17_14470, partial [Actinomycetota bacterium]|nr:hypothetical protein [Actinomycetota bacterium]